MLVVDVLLCAGIQSLRGCEIQQMAFATPQVITLVGRRTLTGPRTWLASLHQMQHRLTAMRRA
jgi:hypothetical protein